MRVVAFTLVELLVVVVILLAIIAIALPVANAVRQRSLVSGCAGNLSQIGKAALMYSDDYQGWLPCYMVQDRNGTFVLRDGSRMHRNSKAKPKEWRDSLAKYTRSHEVFWCAADRFRGDPGFLAGMDNPKDRRSLYTSYEMDVRLQRCMYEGEGHTLRHRLRSLAPDTPYLEDALWLDFDAGAATRSVHGLRRSNVLYVDGHVKFVSW